MRARMMLCCFLLLALLLCSCPSLEAAQPAYRTLRRSHDKAKQQASVRTGYAYGWFGAKTVKHPERHFGYYRHYTQWSWQ